MKKYNLHEAENLNGIENFNNVLLVDLESKLNDYQFFDYLKEELVFIKIPSETSSYSFEIFFDIEKIEETIWEYANSKKFAMYEETLRKTRIIANEIILFCGENLNYTYNIEIEHYRDL